MAEAPKKKTLRWIVLFLATGVVDFVQIILDLTGAGVVVSEVLEAITPFLIIALCFVFRIPIINKPRRLLSLLAVDLGDAITGGIAPFWVVDIWYIRKDVLREEAEGSAAAQEAEQLQPSSQPLNQDGSRQPQNLAEQSLVSGATAVMQGSRNANIKPLNIQGVRRPG